MSGKQWVGRSGFLKKKNSHLRCTVLAVNMLHQHRFCIKNGKRKLKLLISSANFVFFYFYIRQITNFCKYVLKIADNFFYNRRGFIEC